MLSVKPLYNKFYFVEPQTKYFKCNQPFFIKMCINPATQLSIMMFHILGNENCIDFNSIRGHEIIDVSKKINGYNDIGSRYYSAFLSQRLHCFNGYSIRKKIDSCHVLSLKLFKSQIFKTIDPFLLYVICQKSLKLY